MSETLFHITLGVIMFLVVFGGTMFFLDSITFQSPYRDEGWLLWASTRLAGAMIPIFAIAVGTALSSPAFTIIMGALGLYMVFVTAFTSPTRIPEVIQ